MIIVSRMRLEMHGSFPAHQHVPMTKNIAAMDNASIFNRRRMSEMLYELEAVRALEDWKTVSAYTCREGGRS